MTNELLENLLNSLKVGEPGWSVLFCARAYLKDPAAYLRDKEHERYDHECCMPAGFWGSTVHDFYMIQEHEQNTNICDCAGCGDCYIV